MQKAGLFRREGGKRAAAVGIVFLLASPSGSSAADRTTTDLVVPLQDASPRLRFHAGGVGSDGQPALLPALPNLPGPASAWYVAQWQQATYIRPGDLAPSSVAGHWRFNAGDGHASVRVDRTGAGYAYTLSERDGLLTASGGSNLFLATAPLPGPADFSEPVILTLRERLTAAAATYADPTAERSGAVQAMAFVGLGLRFHDPAGSLGDRFVFMQVPITVSRPVPPAPGIFCTLTSGGPSLLYVVNAPPLPFAVQQNAAERRWDLSAMVRGMLSRPYPCGSRMLEWPATQRDPKRWRFAGLYVGLEVQNRDARTEPAAAARAQGHAEAAIELSALSLRRG